MLRGAIFGVKKSLAVALTALALILSLSTPPVAHAAPSGVPGLGPQWTSLMHGDLESTDSTGYQGPGRSGHLAASSIPGGACAATFVTSKGYPVSLCTAYVAGRPPQFAAPVVTLFDKRDARVIARLPLAKGGLLGGVYGYLDDHDRVVVADGSGAILRVGHRWTASGPELYVAQRIDVRRHLRGDAVTGLAPDRQGRVWWATTGGIVGTRDRNEGRIHPAAAG